MIDIENCYERYGSMVMRRCLKLLGNQAQAEDAMQDTFVHLMRNKTRLNEKALSSLLFRIATNVCLNKIRTNNRQPRTSEERLLYQIASLDDLDTAISARSLLGRLFSNEQPSSAAIAVLHFLDGLTLEETAEEVGLSVSGVRKRLSRLRDRLSELAGEES
jgi:RNA polymerase sigma-70 factor (ECF subfamily)